MKLEIDRNEKNDQWIVRVVHGGTSDGGKAAIIATSMGVTKEIAASWCLRHLRQTMNRLETLLVDFGATEIEVKHEEG